ncbi:MAG: hypothetical protein AAGG07_08365 [Planctomycetota bacterium]
MRPRAPISTPACSRRLTASLAAVSLFSGLATLGGCTPGRGEAFRPYTYPIGEGPAVQDEVLDIHVYLSDTHVELTNTTAREFGPGTLWLNQRYGRDIEGLGVGQTLKLKLVSFRDEFGEIFRPGGFFAIDRPERLVLAQLETPDPLGEPVVYGLVAIDLTDQ